MNIQILTPKFLQQNRNDIITCSHHSGLNVNNASYPNLRGLDKDTVSFTANPKRVVTQYSGKIGDIITQNYEDGIPFLQTLSARLLDTMEVIATELEETGLIFDRAYNSRYPVKKLSSYLSKFKRSGKNPKDTVRGTWYLKDLHDLSIFTDKILPALRSRGYEIAPISPRKKIPDFDVRLSGVSEESKNALPKALREVASFKEQDTGYCDIQFRLIDTLAKGGKKTPLEVIIVAGKNTARAKSDESYYVYDITRLLKKELNISEVKEADIHSPAYRVQSNIGIITQQLNDNISKPLFTNAKMADIYNDTSNQLSVGLNDNTSKVLSGLIKGIQEKIPMHYKAKIKEVKSDKTLTSVQKNEKIELLKQQMDDDLEVMRNTAERMKETIEKYGVKS